MRHYLLTILLIITIITYITSLGDIAHAQSGNTITILYNGVPSGTCAGFMLATNISNGDFYNCPSGTWNKVNSAAGGVTSLTGTGIITNSGSTGAVTLVVAGTSGGLVYFSSSSTWASSSAGAAKQLVLWGGAGSSPTALTFPDTKYSPAANCVNAIAGSGWSTAATPASLCRAGTNNKAGLLSPWGASDVGYTQFHIDADADLTTTLPYLTLELTSTDATNGHTIIMQESSICAKLDGTTTDDVAFNAARSFPTITLNGNANRTWSTSIQLNSTDLTGCVSPSILWIKISRTTDTATNVGAYGMQLTQSRLLTSQAN